MSHPKGLCQWTGIVSRQVGGRSWNQAKVLAEYSYGLVMTRRSGLSGIAHFIGELKGEKSNTVRQRLREWLYDAPDKRGTGRQEVEVAACFEGLLRWVLSWWGVGEKRLVLALDATSLGAVFSVLVMSVMYRGCSIPVAWAIVPGNSKGTWQPHWVGMLALAHRAIPRKWCVLVLTDRGSYAKWLFAAIRRYRWHPFMRINQQGQYRRPTSRRWRPLASVVRHNGSLFGSRIVCFKTDAAQLSATLLACWQDGYTDPWLILTDLPIHQARVVWYGMRAWIECGFKDFKRGGWHWEQTRMTDPARAERLWLVMSVATLWVLSVGGEADASCFNSGLSTLTPPRALSCFSLGLNLILVAALSALPLPVGRFVPDYRPLPHSLLNTYP